MKGRVSLDLCTCLVFFFPTICEELLSVLRKHQGEKLLPQAVYILVKENTYKYIKLSMLYGTLLNGHKN